MKVLEWHCTLPEVLDLTSPVTDDLTCSGFHLAYTLLTCLNVPGL